jgi:hypothetical protein
MGGIDNEYVKRIIQHFCLRGRIKPEKHKEVTLAPIGILTGYVLNANVNSRMKALRLQIRDEPSWNNGKTVSRLAGH